MDKEDLFQKKALDRLKKPGALDNLFVITPYINWLLLAAILLLLFSIFIWSVFGVMSTTVSGCGILVDYQGVSVIAHDVGGRVSKLYFETGDVVSKGEIVGEMEQADLMRNYYQIDETMFDSSSEHDIQSKVAQFSSQKDELNKKINIVSTCDGVIINKMIRDDDIIKAGDPIYTVRKSDEEPALRAIVYFPVLEASKIKKGMTIQISPGAIDSSEYGSLVGKVIETSVYPTTRESIMSLTGESNEFATWVLSNTGNSCVRVVVNLLNDDNTPSGYLWTTMNGPNEKINDGMVCTATAIVKREAPLVKAFNKLGQWLRN